MAAKLFYIARESVVRKNIKSVNERGFMKTRVWKLRRDATERKRILKETAEILRSGGLVAFPTETVYGLGANALNAKAVRKIFRAKQRPADNPLIIHLGYKKDLWRYTRHVPMIARRLIRQFWPGPLTLILPRSDAIPDVISGGLSTVAVRMPSHPAALALIRRARLPIAAPSANRSGKPSPTRAAHVLEDLDGRIDAIVDGGPCRVGLESTVLDLTTDPPVLLRPGVISAKQISQCIGKKIVEHSDQSEVKQPPRSPGMKYRHYAPDAPLTLVCGNKNDVHYWIKEKILEGVRQQQRIGILTMFTEHRYRNAEVIVIGRKPETIARRLFASLREMNRRKVSCIYAECLPAMEIGQAILNRLLKAAGNRVVTVQRKNKRFNGSSKR